MKSACKSLIYPSENKHIRAIVTICDYKRKIRKTAYSYNIDTNPERTAEYRLNFGVTGKALQQKIPIAMELTVAHIADYLPQEHETVAEGLKCVLAAPIFSNQDKTEIIGILAFDSFEDIKTIKFDKQNSKKIAQSWADILSFLI